MSTPHRSPRLWDLDTWEEVWTSLRRNRLRTFLTACGVFWGMLMLTLLLGFGAGLQHGVARDFLGLARQSLYIRSDFTMIAHMGQGPGRQVWLTNDDIDVVKTMPGVMCVAPRLFFGANFGEAQIVVAGAKSGAFFVIATTPEFAEVEAIELIRGRQLDQGDLTEDRKVAVLGQNVRRVLFGDENPVGRYLSFRGVFFRVIGETRSMKTGQQADRQDNAVYLPIGTAQRAYNRQGIVAFASVSLVPDAPAAEVERAIVARLKKRHRVHPDDPQGIRSFNVAEEFRRITNLFLGIRVFVWFVGIATLMAGVLGVSNILLITVKERTQELGIRKALGATPSSILRMVVAEALVLTSLAGYAGIVIGVGVLELASRVTANMPQAPISEPEVDMKVVLAAGAVLLVGGLLAAIMPARHATRIHPVEALRAE
jgi:putative ABC transport system permease protein